MTPLLPPDHVLSKIATRAIVHVAAPAVARIAQQARPGNAASPSPHQPVFILGPPRCGSTILYQALTNYFDVLFIDNLAARWACALPYGIGRSMRRFGRAPHNNFLARHGDTSTAGGWHGPSECGGLWYRWIPPDRHYVGPEDVTDKMVEELRAEVTAVQARWGSPLVIKNLHVGQRLAWVARAFPGARYVCIHRDTDEIVDSILTARHSLGIPANELWSTRPPVFDDLPSLPERIMVEKQVERVTHEIERSLSKLPPEKIHHVQYAQFSPAMVATLGSSLGLPVRAGGTLPEFGIRP